MGRFNGSGIQVPLYFTRENCHMDIAIYIKMERFSPTRFLKKGRMDFGGYLAVPTVHTQMIAVEVSGRILDILCTYFENRLSMVF